MSPLRDDAMKLPADPLQGRYVRLEPFSPGLREAVRQAVSLADPVWQVTATCAEGEHFDGWWAAAIADMEAGSRVAYAVRRLADARVIGATSLLHIDPANRSVEIGATFLHPQARGGAANPDMKLAMLQAAFDAGALRVEIRTDERNLRSQAAIAKLGAVRERVLRKQKRLWTGEWRASVVYSVIDEDWPAVRDALQARLDVFAASA